MKIWWAIHVFVIYEYVSPIVMEDKGTTVGWCKDINVYTTLPFSFLRQIETIFEYDLVIEF